METSHKKQKILAALHRQFLDRLPGQVEQIAADWEALCSGVATADTLGRLHHLVHRLHGTSGTYGLHEISELTRDFDAYLHDLVTSGRAPTPEEQTRFATLIEALAERAGAVQDAPPPEMPSAPAEKKPDFARPFRVLLAEDASLFRRHVAVVLEGAGLVVDEAENGHIALAKARKQPPDLVVLDVMMPGLSGLDVLRHMREDEALQAVPVIVMTAHSTVEDVKEALRLGADDFLTKPVDPGQLLQRIEALLAGTAREEPPPHAITILLVEDSAIIRKLFGHVLQEAGYMVEEAENGAAALESMARSRPDLVLMDVMMPVMDGLETLRRMRQDETLRDIPVVILTAKGTLGDVREAMGLDIADYIVKPIRPEAFLERMQANIRRLALAHS
ncbi:response regulator [Rhodocaloribacter litoris]|uniref:response regulator n=1 Tax=Rhodocaloribacter litoris TaxID=2558931 RepID=UPI0014237706|nr:response regulator [Rhodocaloribacter litoris]QXD14354.1 response regulator [Rhodocaloribacter litoris]